MATLRRLRAGGRVARPGHKLLIIGDPALTRAIAPVLPGGWRVAGAHPMRAKAGSIDPYGVREAIAASSAADAALLIVPAGVSPAEAVAEPVVDGLPVGILPVGSTGELSEWLHAVRARSFDERRTLSVLAMWKAPYLEWGERFARALEAGYGHAANVRRWFADETSRAELVESLSRGPDLAIYVGHGRARGWSAYRGFRWKHVAERPLRRAIRIMIALTCDNLKMTTSRPIPFGLSWVLSGRACAFVGAVGAVSVESLTVVAAIIASELRSGLQTCLSGLLGAVDRRVRERGNMASLEAWSRFRIIGNPVESWSGVSPPGVGAIHKKRLQWQAVRGAEPGEQG